MPTVTTNTAANSALRLLNENSMRTGSSISKLASGTRIVTAADDAAGLAIGTRLRADNTVLAQAATNSAQGISVVQVADGGLARMSDILQRLKVLAAQSLSGVPTDKERAFIQAEYDQLISEISGTASSTRFNGESLLDGTGEQFSRPVDFLVGTSVNDTITLDVSNLAKRVPAFTSEHLGGLARPEGTSTAAGNAASTAVGTNFTLEGAGVREINRLIRVADAATTATVTTVTVGGIVGVDAASLGAGGGLTAAQRTSISNVLRTNVQTQAFDSARATFEQSVATATPSLDTTSVSQVGVAAQAFAVIDRAIDQVSEARANIGSIISRFGFRGQQIATSRENIVAAQSSLLDVDVAAEQSRLASSQVLVQASVAALSQANKLPQNLLRLLQ